MANRKTSTANTDKTAEKRFVCTFDGCSRAFTRQEHLQRHSQNHLGGDFTCERCRAHFKRRDLLDRHVTRHIQKDAEGGSLMTRKRSWKDANGNIVTKRPGTEGGKRSRNNATSQTSKYSPALMSPPTSGEESNSNGYSVIHDDLGSVNDQWMFAPEDPTIMDESIDPLSTEESFWEMQNRTEKEYRPPQEDIPYEDAFNPDTASSFNMPFTTMNNYNWLFDMNVARSDDFAMNNMSINMFPELGHDSMADIPAQHAMCDYPVNVETLPELDPQITAALDYLPTGSIGDTSQTYDHTTQQAPFGEQTSVDDSESRRSLSLSSPSAPSSRGESSTQATSVSEGSQPSRKRKRKSPPRSSAQVEIERPMGLLNPSASLPKLDALARSQVLSLIETMRPRTPDGCYVTSSHPLLTLSALQTYSDLYFSRFNTAYPLLHQATFEPSRVETLLLTAILILGATYCEKDAHQLAVCIHDVMRPQIFAHSSFSARPELWVLQTVLLVECFGKSRAGQKQHDMSHLFHGLLINLIRRSDCQTVRPEALVQGEKDLEDDWRAWAEAEQKKRLALLCFMWDTQHAVLFCQSLCMSAFELRSTLPCDQSLWEADSAEQWQKLRQKQKPPPPFLTVLKTYLTARAPAGARELNALSRVLLLHGLMSIAWDMNRRDQTSLGIVGNSLLGDWRLRIANAYDTWKADFDAYTMSVTQILASNSSSPHDQRREARTEFWIYTTANAALYHAAHIILFSEFLDIQIYAGARHILGRPVGRTDYSRSQRVVKRWANEQAHVSSIAAWHAAMIVKDAVMNLEDLDAGGLFIHPWCLYLATITIWSFHHARPTTTTTALSKIGAGSSVTTIHVDDEDDDDEDDEMIWDASADMNALISSMTSGGPEMLAVSGGAAGGKAIRTGGLTAVIAKHLSKIRWAIVHDGMLVLKGLVPWRLISEVESV